jgi:hypothetical protein
MTAQMLIERDADLMFNGRLSLKFYDSPPFLKGTILRNSNTKRRSAYIGIYSYDASRKQEGTHFLGDNWSSLWLTDDNGPQTHLLNTIESRFEELWSSSHDYDELKNIDAEREKRRIEIESSKKIWEISCNKPYLIIVRSLSTNFKDNIIRDGIVTEDFMAMRLIEEILRQNGSIVEIELINQNNIGSEKRIEEWNGYLIYICKRTLDKNIYDILESQNFPYYFKDDPLPQAIHKRNRIAVGSPMDFDPPEKRDICVVAKCDRLGNNDGKMFIIAGLHAMGTWGGSHYLTQPKNLQQICDQLEGENFVILVECEFDIPQRLTSIKPITYPETF